jgi:hypothetical protein
MKLSVELTEDQWRNTLIAIDCRLNELMDMPSFSLPGSLKKEAYKSLLIIATAIEEQIHV